MGILVKASFWISRVTEFFVFQHRGAEAQSFFTSDGFDVQNSELRHGDAIETVDVRRKDDVPRRRRELVGKATKCDELHSRSRFVFDHAARVALAGGHFAFRRDITRDEDWFGVAVAERFKHLKLLEENIIQFVEGDFTTGGDDWLHGFESENLLDGFVKLLAERFEILLRQ